MKVFGITGTSGTGKSTLSKLLNENENVYLIDADKVVREMSVVGSEYLNAIVLKFGNDILLEDGNLNRKKLANKIYNNEDAKESLNELTFDYVVKEIKVRLSNVDDTIYDTVIIDAPLLFEAGLEVCCDFVISLIADYDLKIYRICERDKIDEETAKARLSIQHSDDFYINKSDFVIENNKDCNLQEEIDRVFREIEERK